ncbi:Uncharacterised protein [Mycobacterium tuberculosis]|uniref:Uncharacterized protein n=1 Tax=Mycobacterium tuberculosis TaxID=1773 RepID=A0A655E500_MYCTX|nr:Uncharacterised protein [Mycobacterium tuberculosis]CKQ16182.1 Uncharacterised protein [Mycobacterium tuberculosis]CKR45313.1 Uncharacterised protein [Mycobacterium tuberculosis]CNV03576.1 Uncharacterised protein [Mycobacterium tuberculosis]
MRATAPGRCARVRPAARRSPRPRPPRSEPVSPRRASPDRPPRCRPCRHAPARTPSSWRWRPCGIDGCWWSDAGPGRSRGRWSLGRAAAWSRCRRPPPGPGGRHGRSCARASRFRGLGRCGSHRRLPDRGSAPRRTRRAAGRPPPVGVCCPPGANSRRPETCRESQVHARRRRWPRPPSPPSSCPRRQIPSPRVAPDAPVPGGGPR